MAKIIPKLNLNKTPQLVDNNSLIFAKNIKLGKDASIRRDNGYKNISLSYSSLYLLLWEVDDNLVKELLYRNADDENDIVEYDIIKVIPYNTMFILLLKLKVDSIIISYNELTKTYTYHSCNWHYSGGNIDGNIILTLRNELILTIAEHDHHTNEPIKSINLSRSNIRDDESIYTNAPKINIFNLDLKGYYPKTIPNGVYQFFIRYKISDDNYTNWFPASTELFAGNSNILATYQGKIKYIDVNCDSDMSFVLKVNKLVNTNIYKEYQIGFLLSHDGENYARSWKHFDINTDIIYFDYNTEFIKDIDVTELLQPSFNLYDVGNITNFKNKQYISNYKEFDVDLDLSEYANKVDVKIKAKQLNAYWKIKDTNYNNYTVNIIKYKENDYICDLYHTFNGESLANLCKKALCNINEEVNSILTGDYKYLPETKAIISKIINTDLFKCTVKITYDPLDIIATTNANWSIKGDIILEKDITTIIENYMPIYISNDRDFYDKDFKTDNPSITLHRYRKINKGQTEYTIELYFTSNIINTPATKYTDLELNKNNASLIPKQKYALYLHGITKYGEITNGSFIKNIIIDENTEYYNEDGVKTVFHWDDTLEPIYTKLKYYLSFETVVPPTGLIAWFVTIKHIQYNYTDITNLQIKKLQDNYYYLLGNSAEHLLRLKNNYNLFNIVCKNNIKVLGNFKHSNDSSNYNTFGASGLIITDKSESNIVNLELQPKNLVNAYCLEDYESYVNYNDLIKCTNFFITEYDDNINVNYDGFLSEVYFLYDNLDKYVSGTDLYEKQINKTTKAIVLEETNYDGHTPTEENIGYVYSKYNLNFLGLQNDTDFVPKSKLVTISENPVVTKKYVFIAKDSILLSQTYNLPDMYKEYTRSLYSKRNVSKSIKTFNNTIRSSILNGDESIIYRFKFAPGDYYNVPTNKGIVTNLVSVGNSILVHTQDSLFKFVGNNSLSSNGGENITLKESEVFDTGITEVFGSQYGFGGLADKSNSIVIEAGYMFYDKDSNIIYMYSGEGQVTPISDSIEKLLINKPKSIIFSNDYYNDRVFVNIYYGGDSSLTLSYNLKLASFISIHDINYNTSFNTKTNCYFIKNNNIYIKADNTTEIPQELKYYSSLYPTFEYNNNPACIIDIIFNNDYESIKTLNAISWVSSKINDFYDEQSRDTRVAEEYLDYTFAGNHLMIYNENTFVDAISLSERSNDQSLIKVINTSPTLPKANLEDESNSNTRLPINTEIGTNQPIQLTKTIVNADSYEYPRFNLGFWTLNYFRNTLNKLNTSQNNYGLDDSLIYGKYFVVRFIFNPTNNFKLENLSFNLQYNR